MTDRAGALDAFDAATAVVALGDGRYGVELDEAYTVVGMPNGGYLLAIAARAAGVQLSDGDGVPRECLGASVAYARPMKCGPAVVDVVVDRRGARVSQVHAEITQDGRTSVRALLSMGRLRDDPDARVPGSARVELPAPEDCVAVPSGGPPGSGISIMDRVELRLDPKTAWFEDGSAERSSEIRGWVRLADGRRADSLGLLFLTDVLPPSTLPIGSTGWVPTIQLSAYLKARPADGWLAARQYARSVAGGLLDQGCELWDAHGVLVASATQLAMVRFG
jgi:acyl-coenzyme A thioesterase PaaI-like protein